MAMVLLIQFSDWVYSLKHSESHKRKLRNLNTIKPVFFLSLIRFIKEIIEAVAFVSQKEGQKWKIKWIFELVIVWSILTQDLIVSVTTAITRSSVPLKAFVIICNVHKLFILYYIMYFISFIN